MLTKAEFDAAITRMEVYPAGIDTGAWGTGPMRDVTSPPECFEKSVLKEHG